MQEAAEAIASRNQGIYHPIPEYVAHYREKYLQYLKLGDFIEFGGK